MRWQADWQPCQRPLRSGPDRGSWLHSIQALQPKKSVARHHLYILRLTSPPLSVMIRCQTQPRKRGEVLAATTPPPTHTTSRPSAEANLCQFCYWSIAGATRCSLSTALMRCPFSCRMNANTAPTSTVRSRLECSSP